VANIAFDLEGRITSFGSSFVKPTTISSSIPSLKIEDAISSAVSALGGKFNEHPAKLEYVVKADHSAALAHVVQVQNDATGEWYQAFVDAHNGDLLSIVDFVSHATVSSLPWCDHCDLMLTFIQYRVLPITSEIVTDGFQTLKDPEDKQSSPYGWLSSSGKGDEATTS
jgi:extracellular elastinolytic metalloproteinase